MRRPSNSLGACGRLVAPIHARISPSAETVSNEGSKLIRGRYMAKVIPLRSKSLTNLQSLAAPAHPQPYTRVLAQVPHCHRPACCLHLAQACCVAWTRRQCNTRPGLPGCTWPMTRPWAPRAPCLWAPVPAGARPLALPRPGGLGAAIGALWCGDAAWVHWDATGATYLH